MTTKMQYRQMSSDMLRKEMQMHQQRGLEMPRALANELRKRNMLPEPKQQ